MDAGTRELGQEALNSYGRGFFANIPLGLLTLTPCVAGPIIAINVLFSGRRLFDLWRAARCLPPDALAQTPEFRRAWGVTIAEIALGVLVILVLATPLGVAIPVAVVETALGTGVPALWLGTLGLGMVCSVMLSEAVDARLALQLERSSRPLIAIFVAVGIELLSRAAIVAGFGSSAPGLLLFIASIAGWAWAAIESAVYTMGTAHEMNASARGPKVRAEGGDPTGARLRTMHRPRRPAKPADDDDTPIPID
ncbi:MAG: hypothetical protein U0625_11255 [Phycisphaerales bacterium]